MVPQSSVPAGCAMPPAQRDLVELARRMVECRSTVTKLGRMLPPSDEELDQLFEELILQRDRNPFSLLWMSALVAGRQVDARHLAGALSLADNHQIILAARSQFKGDAAAVMLEALREQCATPGVRTYFLVIVVLWWQEHRTGPLPEEAIGQIRTLARIPMESWNRHQETLVYFHVLLLLVDDASFKEILTRQNFRTEARFQEAGKRLLKTFRRMKPLDFVRELQPAGSGLKREVPKHGRNDPCPCGSGKKYKRCCEGEDRDLLVARTGEEAALGVSEQLEPPVDPRAFSAEHPERMPLGQILRLELSDLEPTQQEALLRYLMRNSQLERIVELCERLTDPPADEIKEVIQEIGRTAMCLQGYNFARRLFQSQPWLRDDDLCDNLLLEEDPAKFVALLEEIACDLIEREKPENFFGMVTLLLASGRFPGLGTLLARGAIACNKAEVGDMLVELLRPVLDAHNWSPTDPAEDILDLIHRSEEQERETNDAVAKVKSEVRGELDSKRQEIRRLKADLERTQKWLRSRQRKGELPVDGLTAHSVPEIAQKQLAATAAETKELRERCSLLNDQLKQRHLERSQMRRELQQAQEALLATTAPPSQSSSNGDLAEEELLLSNEILPNWPMRFPVWPPDVRSRRKIPDAVWRTAVQLTGKLAAGDAGAVQGVKLLKGLKGVHRQRLAGDWRLMFEVDRNELRVLDLVHRRDLVAWARRRE